MEVNYYIYALVCPVDNNIKYIGQTEKLKVRLYQHIVSPSKYLIEWINGLKEKNLTPNLIILQKIKLNHLKKELVFRCENIWINKFLNRGILNKACHYNKIVKQSYFVSAFEYSQLEIETKDKINYFLTTINNN